MKSEATVKMPHFKEKFKNKSKTPNGLRKFPKEKMLSSTSLLNWSRDSTN